MFALAFIPMVLALVSALMVPTARIFDIDPCRLEKQEAGYIDLPNRVDGHYFFWYFESRTKASTDPLLVWLPGGPGQGGTYGLLAENGPCTFSTDHSLQQNPFSWMAQANMVWVDLPINSGFSYSTSHEDDEFTDAHVAESMFWFLQGFLKKHIELQGREIFLVGESYGGHFVPSVAHYIMNKQKEQPDLFAYPGLIHINLQGIAIGNGLTDPVETFGHFVDMADNRLNITLVNESTLTEMRTTSPECRESMSECQTKTSKCEEAGSYCQRTQWIPLLKANRNPYDIREKCDTSLSNMSACMKTVSAVKAYLDQPKVREFLGVHSSRREWNLLNGTINSAFFGPPTYSGLQSVGDKVAELLNNGLRVLMYAGEADILCNVYAIEATAEKLNWIGAAGFHAAKNIPYSIASGVRDAGTVRSFSRLTFVSIFNAGHMAPADQPEVAADMLSRFIRNEAF